MIAAGLLFLVFWIGTPILAWVVFPLLSLVHRGDRPADRIARCQRVAGRGFAFLLHAMRWSRLHDFDPSRARRIAHDGPFLMIANHPTLIDVVLLASVYPKLCTVAKPSLFRNPLIGRLLQSCGHIESPGAGASGLAGAAVIQTAVDRLRDGLSVLIFPEGTRSPAGSIGSMSRGAFEIARRANVPIFPVFVSCTAPVLARGMPWYDLPAAPVRLGLTPLPPSRMDRWKGEPRAAAAYYQQLFAAGAAGWSTSPSNTSPEREVAANEPYSA
jgi:1-acyl-sn-glycerol-3-phosphate acyltransferase